MPWSSPCPTKPRSLNERARWGALRQHVFDILYHAAALSRQDGGLVIADEQY
jgi:hypothetical protein